MSLHTRSISFEDPVLPGNVGAIHVKKLIFRYDVPRLDFAT